MKAQISRFHSSKKVAHVGNIKTYGEFKQAWELAESMGLNPYLIGDGHLNCANTLQIFPSMFDVSGSVALVAEFVVSFQTVKQVK